jgi:hypothetical protein
MTNYTTAKVIADTVNPNEVSARITTFEVYAPRYLLAEINTHRLLSKSAASSRAIPVEKRIRMVEEQPFVPDVFEKNCKGMQSSEALHPLKQVGSEMIWRDAIDSAVRHARGLAEFEVHKQFANRVLEPYVYYHGVITATEWENFWWLRKSEHADPGFRVLAEKMFEAYKASTPVTSPYHMPYLPEAERDEGLDIGTLLDISAARCARVSYVSHATGKPSTLDEDMALCRKLTQPTGAHLSPFDHPAIADGVYGREGARHWHNPVDHRQYWGWIPRRVETEQDLNIKCRRDSFAVIPEKVWA